MQPTVKSSLSHVSQTHKDGGVERKRSRLKESANVSFSHTIATADRIIAPLLERGLLNHSLIVDQSKLTEFPSLNKVQLQLLNDIFYKKREKNGSFYTLADVVSLILEKLPDTKLEIFGSFIPALFLEGDFLDQIVKQADIQNIEDKTRKIFCTNPSDIDFRICWENPQETEAVLNIHEEVKKYLERTLNINRSTTGFDKLVTPIHPSNFALITLSTTTSKKEKNYTDIIDFVFEGKPKSSAICESMVIKISLNPSTKKIEYTLASNSQLGIWQAFFDYLNRVARIDENANDQNVWLSYFVKRYVGGFRCGDIRTESKGVSNSLIHIGDNQKHLIPVELQKFKNIAKTSPNHFIISIVQAASILNIHSPSLVPKIWEIIPKEMQIDDPFLEQIVAVMEKDPDLFPEVSFWISLYALGRLSLQFPVKKDLDVVVISHNKTPHLQLKIGVNHLLLPINVQEILGQNLLMRWTNLSPRHQSILKPLLNSLYGEFHGIKGPIDINVSTIIERDLKLLLKDYSTRYITRLVENLGAVERGQCDKLISTIKPFFCEVGHHECLADIQQNIQQSDRSISHICMLSLSKSSDPTCLEVSKKIWLKEKDQLKSIENTDLVVEYCQSLLHTDFNFMMNILREDDSLKIAHIILPSIVNNSASRSKQRNLEILQQLMLGRNSLQTFKLLSHAMPIITSAEDFIIRDWASKIADILIKSEDPDHHQVIIPSLPTFYSYNCDGSKELLWSCLIKGVDLSNVKVENFEKFVFSTFIEWACENKPHLSEQREKIKSLMTHTGYILCIEKILETTPSKTVCMVVLAEFFDPYSLNLSKDLWESQCDQLKSHSEGLATIRKYWVVLAKSHPVAFEEILEKETPFEFLEKIIPEFLLQDLSEEIKRKVKEHVEKCLQKPKTLDQGLKLLNSSLFSDLYENGYKKAHQIVDELTQKASQKEIPKVLSSVFGLLSSEKEIDKVKGTLLFLSLIKQQRNVTAPKISEHWATFHRVLTQQKRTADIFFLWEWVEKSKLHLPVLNEEIITQALNASINVFSQSQKKAKDTHRILKPIYEKKNCGPRTNDQLVSVVNVLIDQKLYHEAIEWINAQMDEGLAASLEKKMEESIISSIHQLTDPHDVENALTFLSQLKSKDNLLGPAYFNLLTNPNLKMEWKREKISSLNQKKNEATLSSLKSHLTSNAEKALTIFEVLLNDYSNEEAPILDLALIVLSHANDESLLKWQEIIAKILLVKAGHSTLDLIKKHLHMLFRASIPNRALIKGCVLNHIDLSDVNMKDLPQICLDFCENALENEPLEKIIEYCTAIYQQSFILSKLHIFENFLIDIMHLTCDSADKRKLKNFPIDLINHVLLRSFPLKDSSNFQKEIEHFTEAWYELFPFETNSLRSSFDLPLLVNKPAEDKEVYQNPKTRWRRAISNMQWEEVKGLIPVMEQKKVEDFATAYIKEAKSAAALEVFLEVFGDIPQFSLDTWMSFYEKVSIYNKSSNENQLMRFWGYFYETLRPRYHQSSRWNDLWSSAIESLPYNQAKDKILSPTTLEQLLEIIKEIEDLEEYVRNSTNDLKKVEEFLKLVFLQAIFALPIYNDHDMDINPLHIKWVDGNESCIGLLRQRYIEKNIEFDLTQKEFEFVYCIYISRCASYSEFLETEDTYMQSINCYLQKYQSDRNPSIDVRTLLSHIKTIFPTIPPDRRNVLIEWTLEKMAKPIAAAEKLLNDNKGIDVSSLSKPSILGELLVLINIGPELLKDEIFDYSDPNAIQALLKIDRVSLDVYTLSQSVTDAFHELAKNCVVTPISSWDAQKKQTFIYVIHMIIVYHMRVWGDNIKSKKTDESWKTGWPYDTRINAIIQMVEQDLDRQVVNFLFGFCTLKRFMMLLKLHKLDFNEFNLSMDVISEDLPKKDRWMNELPDESLDLIMEVLSVFSHPVEFRESLWLERITAFRNKGFQELIKRNLINNDPVKSFFYACCFDRPDLIKDEIALVHIKDVVKKILYNNAFLSLCSDDMIHKINKLLLLDVSDTKWNNIYSLLSKAWTMNPHVYFSLLKDYASKVSTLKLYDIKYENIFSDCVLKILMFDCDLSNLADKKREEVQAILSSLTKSNPEAVVDKCIMKATQSICNIPQTESSNQNTQDSPYKIWQSALKNIGLTLIELDNQPGFLSTT